MSVPVKNLRLAIPDPDAANAGVPECFRRLRNPQSRLRDPAL